MKGPGSTASFDAEPRSCRVLHRGVEQSLLRRLGCLAQATGTAVGTQTPGRIQKYIRALILLWCRLWNPKPKSCPQGPSTQYLRTLVPKTMYGMAFGTRVLKKWVRAPSGLGHPLAQRSHILELSGSTDLTEQDLGALGPRFGAILDVDGNEPSASKYPNMMA